MPLSRPQSNLLRRYMESPSFESLGHTLTRLLHSENRAEATQGGDQNCGTIEDEGDGEGDVLESGASSPDGEEHDEEHTDAETVTSVEDGGTNYEPDENADDEDTDAALDANSGDEDTNAETDTCDGDGRMNYDSDETVEDEETDVELDANAEDGDTDAGPDANAEDEDTDAGPDANAEDEDTDAELDVNSEDEDSVSGPGETAESEDTDSEPDSNVGDEDVAPPLSLEQPAGSQYANDGGRGMVRKASNTQLPHPHRFAVSNPRRGGGPLRFVTSGLLWIWSNSFFLGPLMIIVGPRIWVRLFLLLLPLWYPFLTHSSKLVGLALKYWEPLAAALWTCFDAWWDFTLGSSLDGPPIDFNLTKAMLWTTFTVTCDSLTVFETVPCTSVETVLSTLTVSTMLTLPFVSILHSSGLPPTSTLSIATAMSNVVVLSNTTVLSSTPTTSRVHTSSSQIPNTLQIESASSSSRDDTCPSLSLPWMAYPASLSPFISIFPTPEPPSSAVPVHDTTMDSEDEGSGFAGVGHKAEPVSGGNSPTASLPSHTLMASPSTTPHPPLTTKELAILTASEAQTCQSSVPQDHSSELKPRHARGTPPAFLTYWHLQSKLLAVVIVTLGLFLLPTIIRALTALLAHLPTGNRNGDGNGGAHGPLSPPEALRNEIYAGAEMVGRWVAAGFD